MRVLDSLVRAHIIVDCAGQNDVEDEVAKHPNAPTVIVTPDLPDCDARARAGATTPARYDAAQRDQVFWASLCLAHLRPIWHRAPGYRTWAVPDYAR
jgi:hypothetical protein